MLALVQTAARRSRHLRTLCLDFNDMTDADQPALIALINECPTIETLQLHKNNFCDIAPLCRALAGRSMPFAGKGPNGGSGTVGQDDSSDSDRAEAATTVRDTQDIDLSRRPRGNSRRLSFGEPTASGVSPQALPLRSASGHSNMSPSRTSSASHYPHAHAHANSQGFAGRSVDYEVTRAPAMRQVRTERRTGVRHLDLRANTLSLESSYALARLIGRCDDLESLDVSANPWGRAGARVLVGAVQRNLGLRSLFVDGPGVPSTLLEQVDAIMAQRVGWSN
jgi:hypothetical protein